jgi:hypothetical protein
VAFSRSDAGRPHRQPADARVSGWPAHPVALPLGDDVTLESIGFDAPLAAFYRTAGAA